MSSWQQLHIRRGILQSYIDYSFLNKACPEDCFSLPLIHQLLDATVGYELLTFMAAFLAYKQIRMHEPDQIKIIFVIDHGLYCYNVMPFRL